MAVTLLRGRMGGSVCRSCRASTAQTRVSVVHGERESVPHCGSFLRRSRVAQTLLSVLCEFSPANGASTEHCGSSLRRSRVAQTLLSVLCHFSPADGAST